MDRRQLADARHAVLAGTSETSFYLAYIVALHCATALALLWFFRDDWERIIRGFFRSSAPACATRRIATDDADERLAWLIVIATIPVGITGLALEHVFRTVFAKPRRGEHLPVRQRPDPVRRRALPPPRVGRGRRRVAAQPHAGPRDRARTSSSAARLRPAARARLRSRDSLRIGLLQVAALLPGISRSGITMVGGLWRGLSHEDAARFAFLLATPVILAAGVLKLPTLFGSAGDHIHGQVAVGFVICGDHGLHLRALARPYFETQAPDAVRDLQPHRRADQLRALRLIPGAGFEPARSEEPRFLRPCASTS